MGDVAVQKRVCPIHMFWHPDVTLRWTITSRQGCDTLLHVIYAFKFREKFEAGPDIELLLYLRPDAAIMVHCSTPPSGKLGAG
jgi:hypothetical protein